MTFQVPTDVVRWGAIGAAKITDIGIGPAIAADPRAEFIAIGSRRLDTAQAAAARNGAARAYRSYDEVLADPEIDIVYNPLPNSMHHEWTIKALEAGKHVLCEKPMALSLREAQEMADAAVANDRLLIEGFMWRYHPRVPRVLELIRDAIGPLRAVRIAYTFDLGAAADVRSGTLAKDIRMTPELGGGALGDVGSYAVNGIRTYAGGRAIKVVSELVKEEQGVDTRIAGQITFDNGVIGQFYAALDIPGGGIVDLLGARGRIRIPNGFRTREEQGDLVIEVWDAAGVRHDETLPFEDQYVLEIRQISSVLLDGAEPIISLEDSVGNATVLDAIRRSWSSGIVNL